MEEKSKILVFSLAVVLMVMPFVTAVAQNETPVSNTGTVFSFGMDAKALSMGGSFVAVGDNYSATYWNPAGLTQFSGVQLGGMQLRPYGVGSLQHAGGSVTFQNFAFGASWSSYSVGLEDQLGYENLTDYSDMVLGGTFAYGLNFANFGVTAKNYQLDAAGSSSVGFDLGTLMKFGGVSLGVSASDVGVDLGNNSVMNATYRLGVAAELLDRALVSAEYDLLGNESQLIKAGFEILPVKQFALRGGVKMPTDGDSGPSFTAGAGVNLAGLTVDIAWLQNNTAFSDEGSDTLVLSAGFKFGAFGESA